MCAKMRSFTVSLLVVLAASVATCRATTEQGEFSRSESQSCEGIEMPNVSNLGSCLNSSCDPSQDLIDAVGPLVKTLSDCPFHGVMQDSGRIVPSGKMAERSTKRCVYEALMELNSPADALSAYNYIVYDLVNALGNTQAQDLAFNFYNIYSRTMMGTILLINCSGKSISVSLPTALIGKCKSDLGTSCQTSQRSFVKALVSLVECLVENALPNAPPDKLIALVCYLISRTDLATFTAQRLWYGIYDINAVLCA